ncbi:hypothetical protein [Legionella busanensis]|uniref:hypothetical protein n=1 Tax=Legionella busanensis TaxID=190655 RepID=UPI00135C3110|nr:hypothetical protein [Legionella busanensis]
MLTKHKYLTINFKWRTIWYEIAGHLTKNGEPSGILSNTIEKKKDLFQSNE